MKQFLLIVFTGLMMIGCGGDKAGTSKGVVSGLKAAEEAYVKEQNPTTLNNYIKSLLDQISNSNTSDSDRKNLLMRGLDLTKKNNLKAKSLSFLYPLIKNYHSDPENDDRLYEMANVMNELKKNSGANIIYKTLAERNAGKFGEGLSKMTEDIPDMDGYIKAIAESVFDNPDVNGVNKKACQNYVDACESFALSNPSSPEAATYLFKASEIARTIKTFPKVMGLYDWISQKYPDHEKAPTVLFLKGFVIENDLKNVDLAKQTYNEFLEKYPSHELADDVKFLLEHIGKTDEEILQLIEEKKEKKQAQ